jgi:2-polyprenyl-6-methoxyphenol hydroxylase-like FAD-dependent oxidoreductase
MIEKPDQPVHTDVLIVGAGPAGLMMACQLALHNVSFRIVDKAEQSQNFSGALLIQARTMEIFAQMGMAEKILQKGRAVEKITLLHEGRKSGDIQVGNMGSGISRFPYIFMLKQTHTRKLLSEFLEKHGVMVERGTRLEQFNEGSEFVSAILRHPDGREENLKAHFLIGADGIHSDVRTSLGIHWEGSRDPIPLFVTDCQVNEEHMDEEGVGTASIGRPDNNIFFSISKKSIAGFFPLEGESWRIDGLVPEGLAGQESFGFEDATRDLAGKLKMNVVLQSPKWFSVFYPNTYLASTFNSGRCFLVGDAAHVHTPIGAQGMNTGLQDAYNLAWKMAYVLNHGVSENLLKTYTPERRPVAGKLIQSTDRYFSLAIRKDLLSRLVRNHLVPWSFKLFHSLLESRPLQRAFYRRISQTGVRYKSAGAWAGKRWPFMEWSDEKGNSRDLHELLECCKFTLVVFERGVRGWQEKKAAVESQLAGIKIPAQVKAVSYTKETKKVFQKFHIRKPTYFLVRPDGYIAMHGRGLDFRPAIQYLKALMSPHN